MITSFSQTALIVHPEVEMIAKFQAALSAKNFVPIVARDLPTALLALTQHRFDVALISSQIGEAGDGWSLAGVLHLISPSAYIGVLVPTEPDVLTLQAAINYGARKAFPRSLSVEEIVNSVPAQEKRNRSRSGVQ